MGACLSSGMCNLSYGCFRISKKFQSGGRTWESGILQLDRGKVRNVQSVRWVPQRLRCLQNVPQNCETPRGRLITQFNSLLRLTALILFHLILFRFILFHYILFYIILFHFILFNSATCQIGASEIVNCRWVPIPGGGGCAEGGGVVGVPGVGGVWYGGGFTEAGGGDAGSTCARQSVGNVIW